MQHNDFINSNSRFARSDRRSTEGAVSARDILQHSNATLAAIQAAMGHSSAFRLGQPVRQLAPPWTRHGPQRQDRSGNDHAARTKPYGDSKEVQPDKVPASQRRRDRVRTKRTVVVDQNVAPGTTSAAEPAPIPSQTVTVQAGPLTDITDAVNNAQAVVQHQQQPVQFGTPYMPLAAQQFAPMLPPTFAMQQPFQAPVPVYPTYGHWVYDASQDWANDPPRATMTTPFDWTTPVPQNPGVGHPAQQQLANMQAGFGFPATTFSAGDVAMSYVGSPVPLEQQQVLADGTQALSLQAQDNALGLFNMQPVALIPFDNAALNSDETSSDNHQLEARSLDVQQPQQLQTVKAIGNIEQQLAPGNGDVATHTNNLA